MKEIVVKRIEKLKDDIKELGSERERLEKIRVNVEDGLKSIDNVAAQKRGAFEELKGLMTLLAEKEEEKNKQTLVESEVLVEGEKA